MGRVRAELCSSHLIASCRHLWRPLSKKNDRMLLIIPWIDFLKQSKYDCDTVQSWQVTFTHSQQLSSPFAICFDRRDSQGLSHFSKHIASYKPINWPAGEQRPQHNAKKPRHRPWLEAVTQAQSLSPFFYLSSTSNAGLMHSLGCKGLWTPAHFSTLTWTFEKICHKLIH